MGCNCRKNQAAATQPRRVSASGTTQKFSLVLRDGSRQTYGSRLEADAANARAGYTGVIKPVAG